jgi:hypothetical protein
VGSDTDPADNRTWADRFPELRGLFGAYFHQDWEFDHNGPEEVIREYIADGPREDVQRAVAELEELLTLDLTEKQLEEVLSPGLRSDCVPSYVGESNREWLAAVAKQLKESLSAAADQ